jgi:hypothetical protein
VFSVKVVKRRRSKELVPNDDKLRELVLYIAVRSEADETYGMVKLNKLLFNSDFTSYAERGEAITNQEYQALPQGPCPRRLTPIIEGLKEAGALEVRKSDFHGRDQKRPAALRQPDLSLFSQAELTLVDRVITHWWGKTAKDISDASHEFLGWRLAKKGETIPYHVALIGSREPTDNERKRGLELEALARAYRAPYDNQW